jgi:5-methylcytosine-specific restriction protein A
VRKRQEFSRKTKAEAFARAKGKCESCSVKIRPGVGPEYDHIIPDAVDGGNDLSNCKVLCFNCHGIKSDTKDKPEIAKTKAIRDKHTNAFVKSGPPMQGSKRSGWKKKMNGQVEKRG